MICWAKLVGASNIKMVIPRRDYSTSASFDMYRHDIGTQTSGLIQQKHQVQVVQQIYLTLHIILKHLKIKFIKFFTMVTQHKMVQQTYLEVNQHQLVTHLSGMIVIIT